MVAGSELKNLAKKNVKLTEKRRLLAGKPEFKRNRIRLRTIRSQLRNRREATEENTYEKHMGLLETSEYNKENIAPDELSSSIWKSADLLSLSVAIVFFDLETGGFQMTCDLL